jgi:hypothetical protein
MPGIKSIGKCRRNGGVKVKFVNQKMQCIVVHTIAFTPSRCRNVQREIKVLVDNMVVD